MIQFFLLFFFQSEGEVLNYNTKERRTKLKYFFLFNDVLLITKREGPKKFWLKVYITLQPTLKIADVPDSTYKVPNVEFRLYAPRRTFIFFCRTPANKESWINDIQSCINGRPNTHSSQPAHHPTHSSSASSQASARPRYDPYTGNASRGASRTAPVSAEPNYEELYLAEKAKLSMGGESPTPSDRRAKGSPLLALAEDLGRASISDTGRKGKVSYVADGMKAPSDGEEDSDFAALRFDGPSHSAKPDQSFDLLFSDPAPPPAHAAPAIDPSFFSAQPLGTPVQQPGMGAMPLMFSSAPQPTMQHPGMPGMPGMPMAQPTMMMIPAPGMPGGYMMVPSNGLGGGMPQHTPQPMPQPMPYGAPMGGMMPAAQSFPPFTPTQLAPTSTLNPASATPAAPPARDPFADLFSLK